MPLAQGKLEGRTAIVTGAAQGIGAEYALALAREGARLCVSDIADTGRTCERIAELNAEAIGIRCDVTDVGSVEKLVAETEKAFGSLDILVNNAAIFAGLRGQSFSDISTQDWDAVFAVNARGVFECCKAAVPIMRRRKRGKIVNVASATVFKGSPMLLHYVASKGAVVAITRALARELGPDGICVNCIAPGFTLSEGVEANSFYDGSFKSSNVATRALSRDAVPEDLVGPVVFLSSDESNFMTGQTVVVDGGSVMH